MTGLIVFAHGSPVESANTPVHALTAEVAARGGFSHFEAAFLDCAEPDLAEAVRRLAGKGCGRILIVPYFLTLGMHLRRDLPGIVDGLRNIYPGVALDVASPLEGHRALVDAVLDRVEEIRNGGGGSESQAG
jgi:sirohydrochlorin cobaltochelatase